MGNLMSNVLARLFFWGGWFIFSFSALYNMPSVKADEIPTVEGEWICISAPPSDVMNLLNQTATITRKNGRYKVQWEGHSASQWVYRGNGTRIEHSEMLLLLPTLNNPPQKVRQQLGDDTKFRHSFSYTLNGDGNSLEMAEEGVEVSYNDSGLTGATPTKVLWTLKRVHSSTVKESFLFAQIESRGEFYFLTKDGRKVSGEQANKIPLEGGTKIVTGNDGHVKMALPDNTTFTLGPNSDLVLDKFVYDPDKSPEKVLATMTKGVFRWVTGKTSQHDPTQMKITLPVVAVGIRGTDFEANVVPDGSGSVVLYFGQLEITEKKTGFTFLMNAGERITFGADGSVSRPVKIN